MMQRISAKRAKAKGKWIAAPVLDALLVQFAYILWCYMKMRSNDQFDLWQYFLYQIPALIAVYCACLRRIEYFGNHWHALFSSPISIRTHYLAKLCFGAGMVIFAQPFQVCLYLICGKFSGIIEPLPYSLPLWMLCGILGAIAICAVQLLLTRVIRSFALPVATALLSGIFVLYAINNRIGIFCIYPLHRIGMHANNP